MRAIQVLSMFIVFEGEKFQGSPPKWAFYKVKDYDN